METIEIRRGTRFYPPGLNDLGNKAPEVLYVRGNHEALAQQAVVVAGSADATPRGRATARRLGDQVSRTDVAVVSDYSSLGRMSLGAAVENGAAIAYFAQPLDQVHDDSQVARLVERGGTIVSLRPDHSSSPSGYEDLTQVLAAHSTVALVPEANIRADSLFVANHAATLGRKIAIVAPPGPGIQAFDGTYELATRAATVVIGENDGRAIIKMVGVAPRFGYDSVEELRAKHTAQAGYFADGSVPEIHNRDQAFGGPVSFERRHKLLEEAERAELYADGTIAFWDPDTPLTDDLRTQLRSESGLMKAMSYRAVVGERAQELLSANRITQAQFDELGAVTESTVDAQQKRFDDTFRALGLPEPAKNYLEMAALLGDGAPDWDQVVDAVERERSVPTVEKELDRLHFTERVIQLKEAGRIDNRTLQNFQDMAAESVDMNEFKSRMHYGGPRMLGATEYRYLQSALDTPEGETPYSWEESEAYVKAFGFDQYETVCRISQMEQDRRQMTTPTYTQ